MQLRQTFSIHLPVELYQELLKKVEKENIRELQGRHPGLVISNDEQNKFSPLITIIPLTSQVDKIYPFQVESKLKGRGGVILVDQIRTIDRKRLDDKLGELDLEMMEKAETIQVEVKAYSSFNPVKMDIAELERETEFEK
ncbi:23356_t:CDS:2, partial [Racocetra persica]